MPSSFVILLVFCLCLCNSGALCHCNAIGLFSGIRVSQPWPVDNQIALYTVSIELQILNIYLQFDAGHPHSYKKWIPRIMYVHSLLSRIYKGEVETAPSTSRMEGHSFGCLHHTTDRTTLGREEWIGDYLAFRRNDSPTVQNRQSEVDICPL